MIVQKIIGALILVAGAVSVFGSCKDLGDEVKQSPTGEVFFTRDIQPIFTNNCATAGCHVSGGSGPMSLVVGDSYGNLVGRTATNGPCLGDVRVLPLNANASALVKRLEGTCGQRMPLGGNQLPSGQIQLIRDWINQGAADN